MILGILREDKTPVDTRVPLTPDQCARILRGHPEVRLLIQPSPHRAYRDEEYRDAGVSLEENLEDCQVLLGVKEVPIENLISNKTYFFFSHTIKKQPYNRDLLRAIINKNIRLIDYECLKNGSGQRVIGFGNWAGVVGAHNAVRTWGKRSGRFELPALHRCHDHAEAKSHYRDLDPGPLKVVITGDGRVAQGAVESLELMGLQRVSPEAFLGPIEGAVYCVLGVGHMYTKGSDSFDATDYFAHPELYTSTFAPYTQEADVMINAIYWDKRIPVFFSATDMDNPAFKIRVIADITCDIAPESSIPSTLRPSEIADPVYGYNPRTMDECPPYEADCIDVMAVDNLPSEVPRDSSRDFGEQMLSTVLPELFGGSDQPMLDRATISRDGDLSEEYEYLRDYVSAVV